MMFNLLRHTARASAALTGAAYDLLGDTRGLSLRNEARKSLEKTLSVDTPHGPIRFACPNETAQYRAATLLTKEPETIAWLETMKPGESLWDVGANVGCYSLYAAAKGLRVTAFEPGAANYHLLNQNIQLNAFDDKAQAYCLALARTTELNAFNMVSTDYGGALSRFGDAAGSIDFAGKARKVGFRQGVPGMTVDSFRDIFGLDAPTHIKIDIDGGEDGLLASAPKTLADPDLKSLLVEMDADQPKAVETVAGLLKEAGFSLRDKTHDKRYDASVFAGVYNYIFER